MRLRNWKNLRAARLAIGLGALAAVALTPGSQMVMTAASAPTVALSCDGASTAGQSYANARFGFRVSVPSGWARITESDNGDGARFEVGSGKVIAFGSHTIDGLDDVPVQNAQESTVRLANGRTATLLSGTNGTQHQRYVVVRDGNVAWQVAAIGDETFFRDNGDAIRQAMCSLEVLR